MESSVWIDFLSPTPRAGIELARLIDQSAPLSITGIVVTEVLQGLTRDSEKIEDFLTMWDLLEPSGFSTYREAAGIFRLARSKGVTITTVDALIAAIAIENDATLFTLDREFTHISRLMNLPLHTFSLPS